MLTTFDAAKMTTIMNDPRNMTKLEKRLSDSKVAPSSSVVYPSSPPPFSGPPPGGPPY